MNPKLDSFVRRKNHFTADEKKTPVNLDDSVRLPCVWQLFQVACIKSLRQVSHIETNRVRMKIRRPFDGYAFVSRPNRVRNVLNVRKFRTRMNVNHFDLSSVLSVRVHVYA